MYVVRRAFRNYGEMMAPGSFVEPGTVKRFKSRLNDGHIVEVNEHDFEKWQRYFKERIGVEIKLPEQTPKMEAAHVEVPKPVEAPKPEKIAKIVKPAASGVVKAR